MSEFFKREDFETQIGDNRENHEISNEKLKKLIESWPVVYCNQIDSPDQNKWTASELKHPIDTHKARLAFIEEIKKKPCKHEPIEVNTFEGAFSGHNWTTKCKHCGVELKATWTEV